MSSKRNKRGSSRENLLTFAELNKIGREIADNNKHKEVIAEIQAMQEACQDAHEVTGDSSLNFKQRHIPKGQLAQAV
jgi:hypothetical protein